MRHWLGESIEELRLYMAGRGQPPYRAVQAYDWLHAKRVETVDGMKNIPAALKQAMAADGVIRGMSEIERRDAPDGLTSKWLFDAPNPGRQTPASVESVLIVEKQRSRRTVCVSSMSGCPLACTFCATGAHGFVRNLSAGEMLEQIYRIDAWSRERVESAGVSHVVFMGMGEPLLNLDAVLRTAATLADPAGMGLSGRHLTISTAGVPDGIRRLAALKVNYRLALSLHAPNQRLRERLMPAAARWPLRTLLPVLEEFAAGASRALTFEYCLIDGINASPVEAREMARLVGRYRGKVNLIPMNPVPGCAYRPPPAKAIRTFQEILEQAGIAATVRMEKGAEIGAACGQLGAERR